MTSESNEEWLYEIIPQKQAEEMSARMERIYEDETTMFNIVLSAPRSSAIDLCRTFNQAMEGDYMAAIYIIHFVGNVVALIEEELQEDGIDPNQP
jgi:hypothetical protein